MKKKLDSRIPASLEDYKDSLGLFGSRSERLKSRIKKIMQADDEVGKIALPVPLLVSKALELFLQTLCDRTCEITLQRGAKTISAVHLKQCVQRFNVFDFLQEIVNKVPDMCGSDALGEGRNGNRRRKVLEEDESEEELKKARVGNGRGHRRGRGRGRGTRGSKSSGKTSVAPEKFEDEDLDLSPECSSDKEAETSESRADVSVEAREPTDKVVLDSTGPFLIDFDQKARVGNGRGHRRGRGRGRGTRGSKSSGKTSVAPEKFEDEDLDLSPECSSDKEAETSERRADVSVEAREPTDKVVLDSTGPFLIDFDLNVDLDENGNVVSSQANVKQLDAEVSQPNVKHLDAEVSQSDLKQEEWYTNWSHSNVYDLNIELLHHQMQLDRTRTIDQDEDDYDNDDG